MKIHSHLPAILLLVASGAWHTTAAGVRATPAEDALLLRVSDAERSNIAAARSACDRANDMLVAAKADCAKATAAQATASGSPASAEDARRYVEVAEAEWRFQAARSVLRDKQTSHANAMASLAVEQVKVAEAGVECANVRAINSLDRPEVQMEPIGSFDAQILLAESQENLARTKPEGTPREVAIATTKVEQSDAARVKSDKP